MKKKINIKFLYLILIIVYKVILEYAYCNIVTKYWGYWFSAPVQNGVGQKVLNWFFIVLFLFMIESKENTLSACIMKFLYLISFIPGCVMIEYTSVAIGYQFLFFTYWLMLYGINRIFPYFKNKVLLLKKGHEINEMGLFIFSCLIILVWLYYAHARTQLALDDIYVARMEARDYNMPTILSYLYSFAKALLPVGISIGLYRKEWFKCLVLTLVELLVYFIEGSKTALFSLFVAYFFWIFVKAAKEKRIWLWIVFLFDAAGAMSILLLKIFGIIRASSYFFLRILFVPAFINIQYYEFFKGSAKDFFRQSIIGKITGMQSPYELLIPRIIGKYAFHNVETNANTGLIGDAYVNLGAVGVIIMPFLFIILLRVIDFCIKGLPKQLYFSLGVILAFSLLSNSFFTTLLSNGIVIIVLYLLFARRNVCKSIIKEEGIWAN